MTVRLAAFALENWRALDGWAVAHNMPDLRGMAMDRFASFVWWWATRNAEKPADVARFDALLWRPPPGAEPKGPWSPAAENAALGALKAGLSR